MNKTDLDTLCINTIRTLCIDTIEKANSGHPGLPLGAAPMAYALYSGFLKHDPSDPAWPDRDRFVLSGGHGSSLLYSLLMLSGHDVSVDDLRQFRQWGSITPGHPEFGLTPGIDATTGPLGQGHANAVGMAIAERLLANTYNKPGFCIVDHYTYAIVTDGDLMEGIASEAASLAGHLKLGKLICLYDSNDVSLDGPTSLTYTEDYESRYQAYGWHVQRVEDGDTDVESIRKAIQAAKDESEKPSLIVVRTTIGFGSPNKAGTAKAHGSPLGPEEVKATKAALGWPTDEQFLVPPAVSEHMLGFSAHGTRANNAWKRLFASYTQQYPALAESWRLAHEGALPPAWNTALPTYQAGQMVATRKAGGDTLNALAAQVEWLVGGDADLSGSTQTRIKSSPSQSPENPGGRNIHFGVREHAMGAICNGIAYHGGLRCFGSTFFVFSDYMRPAVRLAAMNHLPVIYVFTHDSIGVGEDGPTHQPVEHLASFRFMPGIHVLRPGDANEAVGAWQYALARNDGPTALVLSRQNLPVLKGTSSNLEEVQRGAYVLVRESGPARIVLLSSGSELHLAVAAAETLEASGVPSRVVSVVSMEAFRNQPESYRNDVLLPHVKARISIEAGVTWGWRQWVGEHGAMLGLDHYGASAPAETLYANYGLTAEKLVQTARSLLQKM